VIDKNWKVLEKMPNIPSMFRWFISYDCNYKCSYCYQRDFRKKYNFHPSYEELYKTACKVKDYMIKYNFEKLSLQGGEVTNIPLNHMLKICSVFKDCPEQIKVIQIISNFSAKNEYYIAISRLWNKMNLRYMFSYHSDHTDMKNFFEKMENLFIQLKKSGLKKTDITIQYTLTKETKSKALDFVKNFNILKEKFPNSFGLELQLGIYSEYDINCNPIYIYNIRKDNIDPELEKYLIYDVKTKVTNYDGSQQEKTLNFAEVFEEQDIHHLICSQKRVHLERNELTSYCMNHYLTKDFLNTKIDDIPAPPKECNCNFKVCSTYFIKARKED
jgi:hypothetical protein